MIKKEIKYIAYVASSIDGRISDSKNSKIDWTSREDWNFFQKSLLKMNAVVVGYNTYKTVEAKLKKRNTIVLTSKVNKLKTENLVTFFNPKNKQNNLKKFLESKNYKNVAIVGGSQIYNFCLLNKMLDEIFVTIEPYVFTIGIPMFAGSVFKKHKFTLLSVKKLNQTGTILLHYKNANK